MYIRPANQIKFFYRKACNRRQGRRRIHFTTLCNTEISGFSLGISVSGLSLLRSARFYTCFLVFSAVETGAPTSSHRTMATISAASLVDMMLRLHPTHAPKLKSLVDALASGSMEMQAFCAAVRKDLGQDGTDVLLEALIALRSGKKVRGTRMLVEHAQDCNGACRDPGCEQINGMLQTIRTHCLECAAPLECATCIRWGHLAATPARAVPVTTAPTAAVPTACAAPLLAASVGCANSMSSAHKEAIPALMMLARSALGDITDSPVGSRCNSPIASPKPTKRQKKESTIPEASLLTKTVRCAPANESDTRHVVMAMTTAEKGTRVAAPTPLWSVRNLGL